VPSVRFSHRNRPLVGALAALGTAALATGIVLATGTGSSRGASPAAKASGAATVQRRNLVATDTESGTLGYANPQTVYNRNQGTITWLPAVGQLIKPGHALYDVDNKPVVLFDGSTPAYRTLSSSVSDGPDVKELNRDLVKMGFDPSHEITVNDAWQTGTTDAVDRWQSSLGESQTGSITLGQIVFLPGDQRVTSVDAVLGSTGSSSGAGGSGGGSGSGSSSSSNTAGTAAPRPEFASLETTTPTTAPTTPSSPTAKPSGSCKQKSRKGKCTPTSEAALLALLKAETAELQKSLASSGRGAVGGAPGASAGGSPAGRGGASGSARSSGAAGASGANAASSGAGAASSGAGAGSATGSAVAEPILETTSNKLDVVVDLDATKQSEAVVGEPVTVQMPSGSVVNGKITKVSPIAQNSNSSSASSGSSSGSSSSSSSTPSATIPVTIELHGRVPASGLDQAAVSVNFEQQKANNVLSVPVTALLATAGGGYAVQEAAAPHRLIPITPGLFAAGYVQISGSHIYSGLQVTNSQG
jgi:hypothetical protein